MKVVVKSRSVQSRVVGKARWLIGASALATSAVAVAAPPLTINNVGSPTTVGSGQGERAIWTNAGDVGGTTVDIVGVITAATQDHTWSTTSNRPSIVSTGQDDIFIEWRLYEAGTYNINTDSGGTPVTADIHVQFNDVDGPNNEVLYMPVCQGEVKWVRMAIDATTDRAFGTIAGVPEIFSMIGDQNYNNQPESGLEAFWPDSNTFSMGRTANSGYLIRLDNPTYSAFDTLDFECADFIPPVAVDDSKEGTPGLATVVDILENDTATTANNNPPNNNTNQASEYANASVDLTPPGTAINIVTDAAGDVISFTVPGEGDWSYNDLNGELTFTPDPSFVGNASTIDYTFDNALGIPSNSATVIVWYPGMGIIKTSTFNDENSDTYAQVGETVDYVYEMKSYGVEPLRNIILSETTFTGAGTAPTPVYQSGDVNSDTFLGLTETWIYTASYTLVAADIAAGISNSATGTGETAAGTPVTDISDSANPGDGNGTPTSSPGPGNDDPTTNTPPSKPIDADDDAQSGTIYTGGAANAYNVLTNDDLDGVAADLTNVTLAVTTAASHAGVSLDVATGIVSVAPGTPVGNYTIDYEICEIGNPTNCAPATASIVVTAATAIAATNDTPADVPSSGGVNIVNVLGNDDLGGVNPAIGDVMITVTTPATPASLGDTVPVLDPATGNVSVAAGTPAGTYTIVYEFCEDANSGNCASATVTVTVLAPPIAASPDTPAPVNGATGGDDIINAFANDTLNGAPVDAADVTTTITTPAAPNNPGDLVPVMDPATGLVDVPAGTPAGSYTIAYEICETANILNCADSTVTVVVQAAPIAAAIDPAGNVTVGVGAVNAINAFDNDTLNGAAVVPADITATVTAAATPASVGASVPVLDPVTGIVSVATDVPAGSYTIAYEICEDLNPLNCADSTITVTVVDAAISASPDTPAPVNGADGGNDIINAFDNDTLNGVAVDPADIDATVTTPATPVNLGDPVPVLDPATGLVDVPAGTPAGSYTIAYEICETINPGNCADSTITIVVQAPVIAASQDAAPSVTFGIGSANAINAFDNDTLNGAAVVPADITATVTAAATPVSGGDPVPVLDPVTGIVSVGSGVPEGSYTIAYEICEDLNPLNCANNTITVEVVAGVITASLDQPAPVNGATGGDDIINAFDNDTLNGAPVNVADIDATVTTPATPVSPGALVPVLDPATGLVDVPAGTPAGLYEISYEICETINPLNCASNTVAVEVTAAPIVASDDSAGGIIGAVGGAGVVNAFDDDTINGIAAGSGTGTLTVASGSTVPAELTFDASTGAVGVVAGTAAGNYSFDYQLCENLNPTNCATATISIDVIAAPIAAVADNPAPVNGTDGGTNIINAFDNDTLNGVPVVLADIDATVTTPATPVNPGDPVPVLDPATGLVDVPAGTPSGTYTIVYEICDTLNPLNCASNTVTIAVTSAPIAAQVDMPAPVNGTDGGTNIINAFDNDTLNGVPVDVADIDATVTTPATPATLGAPVPVLDPATGRVDVPAGTPAGTYTIAYEICETLNPLNCADSAVTVTVVAAPIVAQVDTPAPVNGSDGGDDIINAFDNDTLNGLPVDPADIDATVTTPATPNNPGDPVPVLDPATGLVDVPAGTPAGTYTIAYEICETLNPTNCATSTVTVEVEAAPIVAQTDTPAPINGITGGTNIINAFDNDTLNGVPVDPADIDATVTTPATPNNLGDPVPVLDPATGLVDVPAGTPAGTYTIAYEICETLNPSNCADSTVTVEVEAAPIVASPDTPAPVNGATGGDDIINAFDNDTLNGTPVDLADITATVTTPANPVNPGDPVPVLDPTTGLVDVPAGTPAGTYTITYEICEDLNPANCATNSITIVVQASPLVATNDSATGINGLTGAPSVTNAFDDDTVNAIAASPANGTLTVAAGSTVPSELTFDPATGDVAVLPNTPAGSYGFDYQLCENLNPTNCVVANVTVEVVAAQIVAPNDDPAPVNGATGSPNVVNAFDNDTLNGAPIDPADTTATVTTPATPANPGDPVPVLDPETGNVEVPAETPAGTYTIVYEVCEDLNSTNCATGTITIVVEASPLVATDDGATGINGLTGDDNVANAFDGDTVNGTPATPASTTITLAPGAVVPAELTFDPATGDVDVLPDTPSGTYSFDYQICENLNPSNCAIANVSIVVDAAPIVAQPDTPAPVNGSDGGDDIVNAFDNDTLNGDPVDPEDITATITTPATPANPGDPVPEMDPETGLVDVPPATPAGTYTITYEICEDLNPTNCGTSSVTVEVEAPEITAENDTAIPVRNGVGEDNAINVFENDTLNGDPIVPADITATVVTPPANPGIVLDTETGIVSVAADVPPGDYELVYQICENLNPDNCTTGTVSIHVEDPRGGISGTVFTDENVDDEKNEGEDPREGWIVEVVLDDEVVATTTTDGEGNYELDEILSGEGYEIVFTNPNNGVVYEVIEDITVGVADTLEGQDLPIDPSGVIYDSVDRTPIAGAIVQLVDAGGSPLSDSCFLDPSQASQVTGPLGEYQFDIVTGAASQCPSGEAEYFIQITPPTGYASNSTVLAPSDGPLDPTGLGSPVLVNPESGPPIEANPPYYLSLRLAQGDPDVIFNHIPLDPFLDRNPLVVTKTSTKRTANVGDIVPYEITVRNAENVQRADVDVFDILPAGVKYVAGSSLVDGVAQEPEVANGNRELVWHDQIIPANGSVRYNLMMIIGAGVTGGEKVNTGLAENGLDGASISNRGTAVVQIVPSAVFDCSELLGKVFEDGNRNGYQDENEPGVPGVRLATVNGQLITTDDYGRYHIACAAVPDARIGSNFVLKVDVRTLPLGWDTTSDNPQSIRLTRGKFGELNFGVAPAVEVRTRSARPSANQDGRGE